MESGNSNESDKKVIFIIENPYHDIVERAQASQKQNVTIFQKISYNDWHSLSLKQCRLQGGASTHKCYTYRDYITGNTVIRVDMKTNDKIAFNQQVTSYSNTTAKIDLIEVVECLPLHKIYPSMTYQSIQEHCIHSFGSVLVHEIIDLKNPTSAIEYGVSLEMHGKLITDDVMKDIFFTPPDETNNTVSRFWTKVV